MRIWPLILIATLGAAPGRGGVRTAPLALACADEAKTAASLVNASGHSRRSMLLMQIDGAYARFRFHRTADAQRLLGAALETQGAPQTPPLSPRAQMRALASVRRLDTCIRTATPPPFASLTVRAVYQNPASGQPGEPAGAGGIVRVEDITVGRTTVNGTLTVQVPSGEIRVEAWTPPSFLAQETTSLEPGSMGTLTLTMGEGKQMVELADLRVEAMRGSDPLALTLRFVTNDGDATITKVVMAVALNREGEVAPPYKIDRGLDSYFTVQDGRIRTTLPTVAADLQKQGVAAIRVTANDAAGFTYSGTVDLPIR